MRPHQVRELAVQRRKAPGGKEEALVGHLLALCDRIRDSSLPGLGVRAHDGKIAATSASAPPGAGGGAHRRWYFDPSLVERGDGRPEDSNG